MSREMIRPVWVISVELVGDMVRLDLDAPDVEVWEYGRSVPDAPRHLTRYNPPKRIDQRTAPLHRPP